MPKEEAILLKEGMVLRKNGKFRDALAKFDEVLESYPKSAVAYREIAIALHTMDEKTLAMEAYKTALKIDPSVRLGEQKAAKREEKTKKGRMATGYKVSDVMATELISVPLGATAKDAAELMLKKNISSVTVREGIEIIGIVTERDFVRNHYYISRKDFAEIPIKDLVAYPLITIPADTPLENASKQMAEQNIRHLMVQQGDDIVGIISLRDVVKAYFKSS